MFPALRPRVAEVLLIKPLTSGAWRRVGARPLPATGARCAKNPVRWAADAPSGYGCQAVAVGAGAGLAYGSRQSWILHGFRRTLAGGGLPGPLRGPALVFHKAADGARPLEQALAGGPAHRRSRLLHAAWTILLGGCAPAGAGSSGRGRQSSAKRRRWPASGLLHKAAATRVAADRRRRPAHRREGPVGCRSCFHFGRGRSQRSTRWRLKSGPPSGENRCCAEAAPPRPGRCSCTIIQARTR